MPHDRPETREEWFCRIMDETVRELRMSDLPHGLTDREIRLIRTVQEKAREVDREHVADSLP